MQYQWVELEEFPDYAVSEIGEIINMKSGAPRKYSRNGQGIAKISLYQGNRLITRSIAVLVAHAFVPGYNEFWNTPIHLDGDRMNCRADNLVWRPRWFAIEYHKQFGWESFQSTGPRLVELNTGEVYDSPRHAAMSLGLIHFDILQSYIEERRVRLTGQRFQKYA